MATAIRNIPTLQGAEAAHFLQAAEHVEASTVRVNISREARMMSEYLKTQNWG